MGPENSGMQLSAPELHVAEAADPNSSGREPCASRTRSTPPKTDLLSALGGSVRHQCQFLEGRSQRAASAAARTVAKHPDRARRRKAPLRMVLWLQSVFMSMHGQGANPA